MLLSHHAQCSAPFAASQLAACGTTRISNIFNEEGLALLRNSVQLPEAWWNFAWSDGHGKCQMAPDILQNRDYMSVAKRNNYSRRALKKTPAYFFKRTSNHLFKCQCSLCQFITGVLESTEFLGLINRITGQNYSVQTAFATQYSAGMFCNPPDNCNLSTGSLAFALHVLPLQWQTEHSGLTIMRTTQKFQVPANNQLVIMDIDSVVTGCISPVAEGVDGVRVSITGVLCPITT
jgi:hypothetical protein